MCGTQLYCCAYQHYSVVHFEYVDNNIKCHYRSSYDPNRNGHFRQLDYSKLIILQEEYKLRFFY